MSTTAHTTMKSTDSKGDITTRIQITDEQIAAALDGLGEYKWAPPTGATIGHHRIKVPGYKVVVCVYLANPYSSTQIAYVYPNSSRLKKLPPEATLRNKKATPEGVRKMVERWMKAYEKVYPPTAPTGPTVRQVLNHAYYGAPLPK